MIKNSVHISTVLILFSLLVLIFHIWQVTNFLEWSKNIKLAEVEEIFEVNELKSEDYNASSTRILFLGDIMLGRNVEYLSNINGVGYSTKRISEELPPADAVIANFESAMAYPHTRTKSYTTTFSTAAWMLPVLTSLKVTHASLANNHSLDFGDFGYANTYENLSNIGIEPFGHLSNINSSSTVVIKGGVSIGVVGINTIYLKPDLDKLASQIKKMNNSTDLQIAFIHWGNEYEKKHSIEQENLARLLVQLGIDVIVGHHPHVTQDIQIVDGAIVFYSLGNFIFDQYFSKDVQDGYVLDMTVSSQGGVLFSLLPITSIDSLSQPRLMTDVEIDAFLTSLANNSDYDLKNSILNNSLIWRVDLARE